MNKPVVIAKGLTYKSPYETYTVDIERYRYSANKDRISLQLIDSEDGSLVATATVNLSDNDVPNGCVIVKDYSENRGMLKFLVSNNIISPPIEVINNGFVDLYVCKLLV